jgi:hypothetical protein
MKFHYFPAAAEQMTVPGGTHKKLAAGTNVCVSVVETTDQVVIVVDAKEFDLDKK